MSLVRITGNATDGWTRERAPSIIKTNGQPNYSPTTAQLNVLGYYEEPSNPPDQLDGKIAVLTGYEVRDNQWRAIYRYDAAPPPPPKVWRKIIIWRNLTALGAWVAFRRVLESQNLMEAWNATTELAEDFDLGGGVTTSNLLAQVRQALPITDEQWNQTLTDAEVHQ